MSENHAASPRTPSRLGNVTGALLIGGEWLGGKLPGGEWSGRELLDRLFVETLVLGGDGTCNAPGIRIAEVDGPDCALRRLVSAFEAATCERVLVVAADLPYLKAELLLALTAWPEADAVVPLDDGREQPLCAIYRRDACLVTGRQRLEVNRLALGDWLDAIDTSRVPLSTLGFGAGDLGLSRPAESERLIPLEGH